MIICEPKSRTNRVKISREREREREREIAHRFNNILQKIHLYTCIYTLLSFARVVNFFHELKRRSDSNDQVAAGEEHLWRGWKVFFPAIIPSLPLWKVRERYSWICKLNILHSRIYLPAVCRVFYLEVRLCCGMYFRRKGETLFRTGDEEERERASRKGKASPTVEEPRDIEFEIFM